MSKYHIVGKHMSWLNYRRGGGAAVIIFRSHQRILQRAVQPLPREAIGPLFEGGGVPVFLREPIGTCGFPDGVGGRTLCPPL